MSIVFFSGSYPPDKCGIGDYLYCLVESFKKNDIKTNVFINNLFSLFCFLYKNKNSNIVLNIQYPCASYKNRFYPHIAVILAKIMSIKTIVTIHEYSSLSKKAVLFMKVFSFADLCVFTSKYELDSAKDSLPNSTVIPIGSNIPKSVRPIDAVFDFCYFGILSPNKGIEEFIGIIKKLSTTKRQIKSVIIGCISEHNPDYSAFIIKEAESLGIECFINKSSVEVSELLTSTKVAILPFPDGISERRGSVLASMLNGALVVSLHGKYSEPLVDYTFLAKSCDELERLSLKLIENYEHYESFRNKSISYAESKSWENIVPLYEEIFFENYRK